MSTDPIAYYAVVEITASEGPVGLVRQRQDGPGRCVDEILARDGSWIPTDAVSRWSRGGELDQDLVLISAGEASELLAWFDDRTRNCPVIGGWTVGQAWWAQFSGDCAVDVLCAQLGLSVHGSLTNDLDRDLGFKVLSNTPDGRITMTLRRLRSDRWTVAVEHLRTEPSEAVIAKVRTEALAAGTTLGLTVESEQTHSSPSVSIDGPLVPSSARSIARLITLSYVGPLDDDRLGTLRHTLHLDQEPMSGEDDEIELGERYLRNDGYHRTRMWLDRADATRWTFGLSTEGRRPPPDWIDHWRRVIDNAATAAGLRLDQEWRTPATGPEIPPQTVPTSLPVHRAYNAEFAGTMTADRLTRLRERVGLSHRGNLADDTHETFGLRTLRDDLGTPVLLRLYRQDEHHWSFVLTYQGEPPPPALVASVSAEILAAAAEAGLTPAGPSHHRP